MIHVTCFVMLFITISKFIVGIFLVINTGCAHICRIETIYALSLCVPHFYRAVLKAHWSLYRPTSGVLSLISYLLPPSINQGNRLNLYCVTTRPFHRHTMTPLHRGTFSFCVRPGGAVGGGGDVFVRVVVRRRPGDLFVWVLLTQGKHTRR